MMIRKMNIAVFSLVFIMLATGICPAEKESRSEVLSEPSLVNGFIYYTDKSRIFLKSEKIRFPSKLNEHELAREIINNLFKGPSHPELESLWPAGTQLNNFFISDDGNAYVDLNLPGESKMNMDTRTELLTIYSLVNSLTLNIPVIKQVKILLAGKDAHTLAGHIDIEYFYQTNMLIVK